METIIVTGTPGTGKTCVAKAICQKLDYKLVDVKRLIQRGNISSGFDKKRQCEIVDVAKLNKELLKKIETNKKGIVIDSHLSHYLPSEKVDLCIVTKCGLKELKKRLEKRGYNAAKVRENLDCEIFDICYNEALENGHNIIVVDTTKGIDIVKLIGVLKKAKIH